MKKFLLSLAAVALGMSVLAETVKITPTETKAANSSTLYVTTDFDVPIGEMNFKFKQLNPSTGQMRVNNTNADAFNLYNTTAMPKLKEVVVNADQTTLGTWYMKISNESSVTNVATTSDIKGAISNKTITFTVPEGTDASYFHINLTTKGSGTVKFTSIEVTYGSDNSKKNPDLSFPETQYSVNIGDKFEAPALTCPDGLSVTYSSSNDNIATVTATGAVNLIAAGTTTITAISEENDEYKAGKAEYTLTVVDPNAPHYTLATSLDQLGKSANILIVNTENNVALSTNFGDNNVSATNVEITTDGILPTSEVQVIMLDKDGDNYTLRVDENNYLSNGSITSKNQLVKSLSKTNATITISENGNAIIIFNGTKDRNTLKYNSTNVKLFACYQNSSTGQNPVQIYVDLKSVVPDVVTPEKKDLDRAIIVGGGTNEDIVVETELWPEDNTFKEQHIYLPENNDIVEMKFNIDAALTNEMFDGIALWSMSDDTTNENVSEEIFTAEGTYAILTPSTAGNYHMRFELKENDHYNSFTDNNYYVQVYPHVNDHFNYDDTELSLCLDQETGIFKLTKYEETCTEGYKYFYKVDNNASVTRAAADEGYTEYNHETGITLEEGQHTLEFVAEKNGVRSYQPKIFSISVSTGVEAIGAEAGEAVYFDPQGRRVNGQPEQGLYIVRKGGKTSKIVL